MSRIFISQTVPKDVVLKYNSSQAANNFCFNLFDNNVFDEMASLVPKNVYEVLSNTDGKVKYFQCQKCKSNKISSVLSLFFSSIDIAKYASKYDNIWYYNVSPSNFISIIILRLVYRRNIYLIMADYTPTKNIFTVQYLLSIIIRRTKGIISLSARSQFKHNNLVVTAGITPNSIISKSLNSNIKDYTFLLSGRLDESTGIDLAIDVFKRIPKAKLIITGKLSQKYIETISTMDNIDYLGLINYDKFSELLSEIPFSLSLRNPQFLKNNNNFPSKILEAFTRNRIVISTMEYPEIEGFLYFTCNYDADSLSCIITKITEMTEDVLCNYANHSALLRSRFSEIAWINNIYKVESI